MDENATPRGIIRGMLTTGGIGESVKLSPRRTPRAGATDAKQTPRDPPSRTEVATRLLTRSTSVKRKATADNTQTPSDSTTPRTLVSRKTKINLYIYRELHVVQFRQSLDVFY